MTSVDIVLDYYLWKKKIKNPKIYISKKLLGHLKEISVVDFDHSDVVRHPLISKIVKAYSNQNND